MADHSKHVQLGSQMPQRQSNSIWKLTCVNQDQNQDRKSRSKPKPH